MRRDHLELMAEARENKDDFKFNKVDNVSGSVSGAGSGEFHVYRAARQREFERLEKMKKDQEDKIKEAEHQKKLEQNRLEAELKTKKRSEKRKKRKQRQAEAKIRKITDVKVPEEDITAQVDDVVPPIIANDGSFLETMLKKHTT